MNETVGQLGVALPEPVAGLGSSGANTAFDTHAHLDPLKWLEAQFALHFWCVLGPPRAYFEICGPIGSSSMVQITYQTFALAAQEDTLENRLALVENMWKLIFKPVVDALNKETPDRMPEDTLLFWRVKPHFNPLANGGLGLRFRLAIPNHKIAGEFSGSY